MPQLNFVKQGQGPAVVLSHAVGCDLGMWDEVAAVLAPRYTVLRYDHRGHGGSPRIEGPFGMAELADDAAALIATQAAGPVHFVGLSMGGMVAQELAMRHPGLVSSVVVANSALRYEEAAQAMWKARVALVLGQGMPALAEVALQRWFTPEFRADRQGGAARVARLRAGLEAMDPRAYAECCHAIAAIDFSRSNALVACPALVIAGSRDEATPPAMSEAICRSISGAQLASLDAAHLSAVERPAEFARLVDDFLQQL